MGDFDPGVRRFGKRQSTPKGPWAGEANAREVALRVLFEVGNRAAFADRLLEARLGEASLSATDRHFVTCLVQGTIRMQRRLDWVADGLLKVDRESLPIWIQLCLRLGIFQLLFLDRVPRHAAVDEMVKLAQKYGHPGTAGLVNAILRRLPAALSEIRFPEREAEPVDYLGVHESHPEWIVRRWLERYGIDRTEALLAANNRPPSVVVRVNHLRTTRDNIVRKLKEADIETRLGRLHDGCLYLPAGADIFASEVFRRGLLSVQDESESLIVPLLNPRPGERILDLCTAPGAKLSHIVEWSRGQAFVVGVEPHAARLRRTREGLARLGHTGVGLVCADGRAFGSPGSFDRVLVDAPCSGLGVLRRRTDARWRKSVETIHEMAELQAELLDRAAVLVRPGGWLVYSVCSFEPEEAETQIDRFLARHEEFRAEHPGPGFPAEVVDERGFYRLLHDELGTDGAFAARLRRRVD